MTDALHVFNDIKTLLTAQRFAVLATQSDVSPYCSLVSYVSSEDGSCLWFATSRDTHKYANLKKNAAVSLLIGSQTNQVSDLTNAHALTAVGMSEEVPEIEKQDVAARFVCKHPDLTDFVGHTNCAFIKVVIAKYVLVKNFENVFEYTFPASHS